MKINNIYESHLKDNVIYETLSDNSSGQTNPIKHALPTAPNVPNKTIKNPTPTTLPQKGKSNKNEP